MRRAYMIKIVQAKKMRNMATGSIETGAKKNRSQLATAPRTNDSSGASTRAGLRARVPLTRQIDSLGHVLELGPLPGPLDVFDLIDDRSHIDRLSPLHLSAKKRHEETLHQIRIQRHKPHAKQTATPAVVPRETVSERRI